jgi:integrase
MDVLYNMKREMLRRGLSPKTVKTYLHYVKQFLLFCCGKEPRQFSKKDVREFLYGLQEKGRSGSTLNVAHNALRFMMIEVLHKGMYLKLKYSKTAKKKPGCLTKTEIRRLLDAINNPTHRLIVALMYGAGLRVGEVVRLRPEDVDIGRGIGWVRQGKGRKDRPFIVPQVLEEGILGRMDGNYLFPGRNGHISVRSVQEIVRRAGQKIGRRVHPHMLRHSFTTHIMEYEDASTVQGLLGHAQLRTTLHYTHSKRARLVSARSPLEKP